MDAAPSLERHGPLGRFDAPVEAEYRRWFVRRLQPMAIAMGAASLVVWLVAPPLFHLVPDMGPRYLVYLICWGVNAPALVLGILYMRRVQPRYAVAVGTSLILLTALDTLAGLMLLIPDLDPAAFALAATFYGILGPLVLMPFRLAVFAAVVITAIGEIGVLLVADGTAQNTWIAVIWIPLSTMLIGLAMAFVGERALRAQFAGEVTIEQQRALIRRYAPSSVVSRIELGDHTVDHPQRRKVTVLFCDVVGFTALADRVDPEALAEIVNDYLGALSDLIERHGGTLNEFAGDGVMAIFGAPDELDPTDQVRAAVAAARELQDSLPAWSRDWYQHGIVEDARARVGINTGTVSVGTFGSAVRATYTGIGLQTNIAARVQAQAAPGGILLSNTSWHLVKDELDCEPRGEVLVKGVHFPIGLYEVVR